MFDIQVRLIVNGRPVGIQEFAEGFFREIAQVAQNEIQKPSPAFQPLRAGRGIAEAGGGQKPKPLAVGINEAAKMIGLSPWTIRLYVAQGKIRVVRIGRRVLVPMEVLEKVMAEGVKRERE